MYVDNQSRAEMFAHQSLGVETARIKAALRNRTIVIGISENLAKTRQGQIGLVSAVNILTRLGSLAPNIYLDIPHDIKALPRIPLLIEGQTVSCQMLNFMQAIAGLRKENIVRNYSDKHKIYDLGLFIGRQRCKSKQAITIGSNNWLAFVNPTGKCEKITPSANPLGTILAAALGITEIVKHLWMPIKDSDIEIDPLRKRTVISSYDFSINKYKAENPAIPQKYSLGHACIFGLGAIGSACNYILGCFDNPELSLDFVDSDKIEPSNEERLFTSSQPGKDINTLKVVHAQRFMKTIDPRARAFSYGMLLERFVEMSRDRLGYVFCCLDSGSVRRRLQTELASVIANGGTDMSRWMVSVHEFDRPENACLLDLYKEQLGDQPDIVKQLADILKISVNELLQMQRIGNHRIDGSVIIKAMRLEQDPAKKSLISRYAGLTVEQSLGKVCTQASPSKALPAATISFVSLIPGVLMVSDFAKRRIYGWKLPEGSPNVIQADSFRQVNKSTAINILASDKCYCRSERYVKAFEKRQKIRNSHLNKIFLEPARQVKVPIRPPVPRRPQVRPRPVYRRPQVNRHPKIPPPPVRVVVPKQSLQSPWFPSPYVCCFAMLLYLAGMVGSLILISLFVRHEVQANHLPIPWRIIPLCWEAGVTIEKWLKYSIVSALPVMAYWFFMKLATYIMKGKKRNNTLSNAVQKPHELGARWGSKLLATVFQIIGLPFLLFSVAAFGTTNIRALFHSIKFMEIFCCAIVPILVFFFCEILIFSVFGIMQIVEPTQVRCDWVFNLPAKKREKQNGS